MSSAGCSDSLYLEKDSLLPTLHAAIGTHKVKFQPDHDWDFHLEAHHRAVDLSLVLPHYRARNQPVNHQMSMFVGGESGPIKLRVCRHFPRSKFYLEVQAGSSDVTVWLPSDFKGHIRHSGKACFSAGFVNRIMKNVRLNEGSYDALDEDDVVVFTRGHVSFRMWDISTGAPENPRKETIKRLFGCARKSPETVMDWDFLLED
ncbi:hypothetical protein HGRIS_013608 [Hohenbuehelia grisea]|uniref:DUF7330 domain-containing protein n=1 Tax=Hohenbuehelia grisea TaxID=104357 RepID=A0ABR3IW57_9AGAR